MTLSEDGQWMWNGTEWVPNEEAAAAPEPAVEAAPEPAGEAAPAPVVMEAPAPAPAPAPEPAVAMPAAAAAPMPAMGMAAGGEWAVQTAEYGLFFTKLIALLMKVCTFGLALPWAECMVINKWASKVRIDGRAIKFTGTGGELFGVWLKVFLLSAVTLSLYYWFAGYKAVAKYVDSHLAWA